MEVDNDFLGGFVPQPMDDRTLTVWEILRLVCEIQDLGPCRNGDLIWNRLSSGNVQVGKPGLQRCIACVVFWRSAHC